jgi:hypothetical protein
MGDERMGDGRFKRQGFVCAEECLGFIDLVATKRSGTRMERVPTEVDAAQVADGGVQSSSAASWGNSRRFTRAVLECLDGNLGSLFGHAELTGIIYLTQGGML